MTSPMTSSDNLLLLTLNVNGEEHEVITEPRRTLVDVLRHDLRLTGTHVGCEHGICGACTVLVDDRPARACLMFAAQAEEPGYVPSSPSRIRRPVNSAICNGRSPNTTACSAASAHPDS